MVDVIKRVPESFSGTYEHKLSVNTPDYSTADFVRAPDLSGVSGVTKRYWKVEGDAVVEMSTLEKTALDLKIAANPDTLAGRD